MHERKCFQNPVIKVEATQNKEDIFITNAKFMTYTSVICNTMLLLGAVQINSRTLPLWYAQSLQGIQKYMH